MSSSGTVRRLQSQTKAILLPSTFRQVVGLPLTLVSWLHTVWPNGLILPLAQRSLRHSKAPTPRQVATPTVAEIGFCSSGTSNDVGELTLVAGENQSSEQEAGDAHGEHAEYLPPRRSSQAEQRPPVRLEVPRQWI
jgi:hypothetical protein